MQQGILNGIRILDFTRVLAGPYATRLLGDFGAEVIKIQSGKTSNSNEDNSSAYFSAWNRNKLSITLNMNYPEAREIVLKLAAICDIVIENFSPRVMSNWDLDYKDFKEIKKDIILARMSGFGQSGPWKDYTAYSPAIQSISGHTYLTSYNKDEPVGPGFSQADITAGLYTVFAVLAALEHRSKTGIGQLIDISEYECACTMLGPALMYQSVEQTEITPQGNRSQFVQAAPYGCYKCFGDDRWCVIAVNNETEWNSLCNVMGSPAWTSRVEFTTLIERKVHENELDSLIQEWTMKHTPEKIVKCLREADVPSGVVQNAMDLANDPHLLARKYFVEIDHPVFGRMMTDKSPIRFNNNIDAPWKASSSLGEHNNYVYHDLLDLSNDEINSLIKKGVIT
jgi:benzylsuccinate CoA-transferase BbsF subunit